MPITSQDIQLRFRHQNINTLRSFVKVKPAWDGRAAWVATVATVVRAVRLVWVVAAVTAVRAVRVTVR